MPLVNDLDSKIEALVYGQRNIVYVTQEFPTRNALVKLPEDEQIDLVCQRYKFWTLRFAEELSQRPDGGYAALLLLNPYFDMIASLSGYATEKPETRVKNGIPMVFPELATESKVVEELFERLRNPMAHMGITRDRIILLDEFEEAIVWGPYRGTDAIVINPRLWVKRISQHFDEFTARLRNQSPENDALRGHFIKRIAGPA